MIGVQFEVNKAKGESPYKIYASNEPVQGFGYAVVSKLTKEHYVKYEIHKMNAQGGTLIDTKMVSSNDFYLIVKKLEAALQKANPNVLLQEESFDEQINLKSDKLDDAHIEKLADFTALMMAENIPPNQVPTELIIKMKQYKREIAHILSERTREAAKRGFTGDSPNDELFKAVNGVANEIADKIKKEMARKKDVPSFEDMVSQAMAQIKNETKPSSRLSNFL